MLSAKSRDWKKMSLSPNKHGILFCIRMSLKENGEVLKHATPLPWLSVNRVFYKGFEEQNTMLGDPLIANVPLTTVQTGLYYPPFSDHYPLL